jgi:mRNA-degrading endonuclease RelE of RelBE toxin-antitoxin system
MQYRLLISIQVVEFVERLPAKIRRQLRHSMIAIGEDPLGEADAEDFDEIGRILQISIIGDYALTYWVDDADCHIKILDVHAADR